MKLLNAYGAEVMLLRIIPICAAFVLTASGCLTMALVLRAKQEGLPPAHRKLRRSGVAAAL
jgi:hypothetical protein